MNAYDFASQFRDCVRFGLIEQGQFTMSRTPTFSGAKKHLGRVVLDSDRHVPYFFTFISSKLSHGASRLYRKLFKIGITEWRIMSVLAGTPDVSANQIGISLGINKGAVSRSLQTLEKMKLISLSQVEHDNRSKTIKLSSAGLALHDKIIAIALERERLLLSSLTAEEREAFIDTMRKLRSAVTRVNQWMPTE